jgi:hypothetical protein
MKWIEVVPGLWRTDYPTTTKLHSNSALCKDKKAFSTRLLDEWDGVEVVLPLHGNEIRGDDVAKAREFLTTMSS